jgi:hypothetical protein
MKPGDKVICIDASKEKTISYNVFKNWIVEQEKYTVRRVEGGGRILLEEVTNPPVYVASVFGKVEPGFAKKRFANYEDYILGKTEENEESRKYELHSN